MRRIDGKYLTSSSGNSGGQIEIFGLSIFIRDTRKELITGSFTTSVEATKAETMAQDLFHVMNLVTEHIEKDYKQYYALAHHK